MTKKAWRSARRAPRAVLRLVAPVPAKRVAHVKCARRDTAVTAAVVPWERMRALVRDLAAAMLASIRGVRSARVKTALRTTSTVLWVPHPAAAVIRGHLPTEGVQLPAQCARVALPGSRARVGPTNSLAAREQRRPVGRMYAATAVMTKNTQLPRMANAPHVLLDHTRVEGATRTRTHFASFAVPGTRATAVALRRLVLPELRAAEAPPCVRSVVQTISIPQAGRAAARSAQDLPSSPAGVIRTNGKLVFRVLGGLPATVQTRQLHVLLGSSVRLGQVSAATADTTPNIRRPAPASACTVGLGTPPRTPGRSTQIPRIRA